MMTSSKALSVQNETNDIFVDVLVSVDRPNKIHVAVCRDAFIVKQVLQFRDEQLYVRWIGQGVSHAVEESDFCFHVLNQVFRWCGLERKIKKIVTLFCKVPKKTSKPDTSRRQAEATATVFKAVGMGISTRSLANTAQCTTYPTFV